MKKKKGQITYRTQAMGLVAYVTHHYTIELHSQNIRSFTHLTNLYKI